MKAFILLPIILLFSISCGSSQKTDCNKLLSIISADMANGNLNEAIQFADSLKKQCPSETTVVYKADSLADIAQRIRLDFSLTEEQIISELTKNLKSYSPEEKESWEKLGWLEYKIINGEKRYFNRAASNLNRIKSFILQRAERDSLLANLPQIIYRKNNTESIIKASGKQSGPVTTVEMTINYKITVKADAVPEGEIVRCWLPWPKESNPRQQNIKQISTSQDNYQIAPDSAIHRSIYMEAIARKGVPLIFSLSYSYQSSGQYSDLNDLKIKPYDKTSALYKRYTSEQLPQICFTDKIRKLTDSIVGNENRPVEIVRKIYYWFNKTIPWAGALEYSIMPNIPEYVLMNKKGDCGMQTFLYMSMLRYKGIPIKWQSGWMMDPIGTNLHDWSEIYYEGVGWVPSDISRGLQYSDNLKTRDFYISGIDSYRLIVNDGISGRLYPEKKFMRSEPFDFQRGEVEWNGGNLYFDKWNYNMKIEYTGI
jgi:hypothetical protein